MGRGLWRRCGSVENMWKAGIVMGNRRVLGVLTGGGVEIFLFHVEHFGVASVQLSGIRDQGSGIRDQGSGIRDQGSGIRRSYDVPRGAFGIFRSFDFDGWVLARDKTTK
jgi:hypothetical protein